MYFLKLWRICNLRRSSKNFWINEDSSYSSLVHFQKPKNLCIRLRSIFNLCWKILSTTLIPGLEEKKKLRSNEGCRKPTFEQQGSNKESFKQQLKELLQATNRICERVSSTQEDHRVNVSRNDEISNNGGHVFWLSDATFKLISLQCKGKHNNRVNKKRDN